MHSCRDDGWLGTQGLIKEKAGMGNWLRETPLKKVCVSRVTLHDTITKDTKGGKPLTHTWDWDLEIYEARI